MPKYRKQQIQVVDNKETAQVIVTSLVELERAEIPDRIRRLKAEIGYLGAQQQKLAEHLELLRQELTLLEQFNIGST